MVPCASSDVSELDDELEEELDDELEEELDDELEAGIQQTPSMILLSSDKRAALRCSDSSFRKLFSSFAAICNWLRANKATTSFRSTGPSAPIDPST
jgi:hypothetical protein